MKSDGASLPSACLVKLCGFLLEYFLELSRVLKQGLTGSFKWSGLPRLLLVTQHPVLSSFSARAVSHIAEGQASIRTHQFSLICIIFAVFILHWELMCVQTKSRPLQFCLCCCAEWLCSSLPRLCHLILGNGSLHSFISFGPCPQSSKKHFPQSPSLFLSFNQEWLDKAL